MRITSLGLILFLSFSALAQTSPPKPSLPAEEITIAAAADLQFVMQDIAARFQKETGTKVKPIYGSSGNFFQQIQNGAPLAMFFSANLDYPRKLEAAGPTEPGTLYQSAIRKNVNLVPHDSAIDVSTGLHSLLNYA